MQTPVQFSMLPPVPEPWNKGKLTGQKPPLKLKEIWAIRIRLQLKGRTRDLASRPGIFVSGEFSGDTEN